MGRRARTEPVGGGRKLAAADVGGMRTHNKTSAKSSRYVTILKHYVPASLSEYFEII